jgi:hypothetical protein
MTTRTTSRPGTGRRRGRDLLDTDLVAVAFAATLALGLGPLVLRGPSFVGEVSVINSSEYDIGVRVSDADRTGWVIVTSARRSSTTATAEVVDQGDVWTFRFSAQGRYGGELQVTRSDLEQVGWSIEVPDDVIRHLRDLDAPPPP